MTEQILAALEVGTTVSRHVRIGLVFLSLPLVRPEPCLICGDSNMGQ